MDKLTTEALADKMLVFLVCRYAANPSQMDIGISDNDWHVLFVVKEKLEPTDFVFSRTREAVRYLEDKGFVKNHSYNRLTAAGRDHARLIMRRRWRKALDYIKGDVRTVVVAAITTIVALLLAKLVERLFA